METTAITSDPHEHLEHVAYYLWLERGRPFGSPEVDWFHAEEQWRERSGESALVSVAKAMGGAMGSIAGFVESHLKTTVAN